MRSGATWISAAPPPSRPTARSPRRPQDARTTAASCSSLLTVGAMSGPRSPPSGCGSSSRPTPASGITALVRLLKKCNIDGMPDTHVVTNQVPPLENHNPATSAVLVEALIREGGQWGLDEVNAVGALSASREAQRWGELADRHRPVLHTHDRYGHRVDEVEYDPAYHELMRAAGRRPARRACRAGGQDLGVDGGGRPRLPDLDDVRGRPGAAVQPRIGRGLRAVAD